MTDRERMMRVEEVALTIGSSVKTINMWYMWKSQNPEHELAKLLPDFKQNGARQTRYWNYSDIWRLINFKNTIPHGRNGVLGSVTQKYAKEKIK